MTSFHYQELRSVEFSFNTQKMPMDPERKTKKKKVSCQNICLHP